MKVIIYNKNLNAEFWTANKQLRPEIRSSLLKIANTFFKDIELNIHIRDVLFLGSSANYNWTPTSDCDLHLLVDFNDLPMAPEEAKLLTKTLAKKWNEEHDISIKGHNVEVYIQDVQEENRATGVFSLIQNKWIKEAMPQNIVLNKNLIQSKYTTWVNRINTAVASNNVEKLKKTMEDLTKMRETGLQAAGEFSTENIVFKILRQRDVIGKLKTAVQNLKNQQLSVKDAYDPTSFGPNPAATVGLSLFSSDGGFEKDFYQRNVNKMRKM